MQGLNAASMPQASEASGAKLPGLTGGALKTIAIAAMLVDHIAAVFIMDTLSPLYILMRFIGRITGPVMFYLLVEGYHHTRNYRRYVAQMALFAVVSYVPFIYCFDGTLPNAQNFYDLNVIYTLTLALLALGAWHRLKNPVLRWGAIGVLLLLSVVGDWGYLCILIVLVFDVFRGDFKRQAFAYAVIVLLQVLPTVVQLLLGVLQSGTFAGRAPYTAYILQMCGMAAPMLLLRFYNGQRGRGSKWLFYIFYPAHLLVLGVIHNLSL